MKKEVAEQVHTVIHELDGGWCRANQHIWEHQPPFITEGKTVKVTFQCAHCSGLRYDTVSLKSGELLFRNYDMPSGYVLRKVGDERPTKNDWRKAHYQALVGGSKPRSKARRRR